MTFSATFARLHWLNLPSALLVVLLQRLPALRAIANLPDLLARPAAGAILRSAALTVGSLGALHSLAGATRFVTSTASPVAGSVGTPLGFGFAVNGAQTPAGSYRVTGTLPPGLVLAGGNASGVVNGSTGTITGTPNVAGSYAIAIRAYEHQNATGDAFGPLNVVFNIAGPAQVAPTVTLQPASVGAPAGSVVTLTAGATGTPAPNFQWLRNGLNLPAGVTASLALPAVQPADTGLYWATIANAAGTVTTTPAIVGLQSGTKVVGPGAEFPDIFHPGTGFYYDQILLEGPAASVTADPGQVVRISYVDTNDDIVQVEFSGAGTLSLALEGASGPAAPVKYAQNVAYMKGHAGIVIVGADETTNVSVFSVGRITAVNQALFGAETVYDGLADVAFLAISSRNGKFGGLRCANASFFAVNGITGIYAPEVEFLGPVFVGDINAFAAAIPMFVLGSVTDSRITGGDLAQDNGRPVQVKGVSELRFVNGSTSHGTILPAARNRAQLQQDGADVTRKIVIEPAP